jgi:transketolase N-terminal domain/subunit
MQAAQAVPEKDIAQLCINTIRTLSMDAVQQANSGHPGAPMAMAPIAYCLWQRFLRFDPNHPIWPNRDRFVLSAGHASMLLYSMLHLTGVKAVNPKYETLGHLSVTLDDIKHFRQLDSKCPGHPEYRWTSGVETTTGPLGQGLATSVGMAIAARWFASTFNRPGFELFDYDVYALCGDGCMMEGISGEAASLAGHLKLDNLCWIYDNNHITIEGNTALTYSDDVATRFLGYGWNVTRVGDANDLEMLERAFCTFKNEKGRPTLIIVDSHIAPGTPNKQDTSAAPEPWANRRSGWRNVITAGLKTPSSWCLRACASTSRRVSVRAARRCATPGWPSLTSTRSSIPISRSLGIGCSAVSCPTVGIKDCRRLPPTRRESRLAMRPARCLTWSQRMCRGCSEARPTSGRHARRASRSKVPATLAPRTLAEGTSTLELENTPWAPS